MQINPDTKQILGLSEPWHQPATQSPKNKVSIQADGIESGISLYLEKTRQIATDETIDIEQIRKELDSGQYDKPEIIRSAAKQIVQFGI
ncbi:MAG TPA: hypothetical protein PKB02_15750 [Anaerohalosphaeraceae bacterium]|nr:hypothetical protein [Anaerohalosphaeraceae bacterium]